MTDPVWPAELPQRPLADGYSRQPADLVIRTEMTGGVPKVRRRQTKAMEARRCQFALTDAQKAIWVTFWSTALSGGAQIYTWNDPEDGTARSWRVNTWTIEPRGAGRWTLQTLLDLLPEE